MVRKQEKRGRMVVAYTGLVYMWYSIKEYGTQRQRGGEGGESEKLSRVNTSKDGDHVRRDPNRCKQKRRIIVMLCV